MRKAENSSIFLLFIRIVKKIEPRKVLPISPINNLEGSQLKNKNASREVAIGIYELSNDNDAMVKITKKHPATRPSIPSIKLEKLISETPNKTRKGIIKYPGIIEK